MGRISFVFSEHGSMRISGQSSWLFPLFFLGQRGNMYVGLDDHWGDAGREGLS